MTDTVPGPVPIVMVAEIVAPPAVTAHPVPVTDQDQSSAGTAVILKIFPVLPEHVLAG